MPPQLRWPWPVLRTPTSARRSEARVVNQRTEFLRFADGKNARRGGCRRIYSPRCRRLGLPRPPVSLTRLAIDTELHGMRASGPGGLHPQQGRSTAAPLGPRFLLTALAAIHNISALHFCQLCTPFVSFHSITMAASPCAGPVWKLSVTVQGVHSAGGGKGRVQCWSGQGLAACEKQLSRGSAAYVLHCRFVRLCIEAKKSSKHRHERCPCRLQQRRAHSPSASWQGGTLCWLSSVG